MQSVKIAIILSHTIFFFCSFDFMQLLKESQRITVKYVSGICVQINATLKGKNSFLLIFKVLLVFCWKDILNSYQSLSQKFLPRIINILFPLLNLINFLGSFLTVLDILRDNGASSPKVGFLRRLVQIAHWRQGCFPLSFLFFYFGFIFFSPRKSLRVTKWSWYIL